MWCYSFKGTSFKNNTFVQNTPDSTPILVFSIQWCTSAGLYSWPGRIEPLLPPGPLLGASGLGSNRSIQLLPQNISFCLMYCLFPWIKHPNCHDFCLKCKSLHEVGCRLPSRTLCAQKGLHPHHQWVRRGFSGRHNPPGLPTILCMTAPQVWASASFLLSLGSTSHQ